MRYRSQIIIVTLLAVIAAGCGDAAPDDAALEGTTVEDDAPGDGADEQPAADDSAVDRAVGEDSPDWDVEQAIRRTLIVEDALEDGLDRTQAGCIIDTTIGAGDFALLDLVGIDLTTNTSSTASTALAEALADSLIECGASLRAYLNSDIPGSSSIPESHSVESDCLTNAYVEAWREAYANRFSGATAIKEAVTGRIPEIAGATTAMVAACDVGGGVILGASNEGHLDTFALTTLEWECLVSRLDADQFMPAFPFPEEPGDALARLGESVQTEVAFCTAWVAGEDAPTESPDIDEANG